MKIAVVKEKREAENRVAITPTVAQQLIKVGYEIWVEPNAGYASNYDDGAYVKAGCSIKSKQELLEGADILAKVNAPDEAEINS
jgi:NAD(P) transhydrogenase subunit alpha